jgi:hypothetical protein
LYVISRAAAFGGIRARTLFKAYASEEEPGNSIKVSLLVQVDDEGRAESHYRFALEGDKQKFDFWSEDIFTTDKLTGFEMKIHIRPEEITIRQNSTTSKWENLEDLVAKGDIIVTNSDDQEDQGARFREAYEMALQEDHDLGAAVRWAIVGKKGGGLRLALEGLPTTAQALSRKPELSSDTTAAIILDAARLNYNAEPDSLGGGPIPILFARDPSSVHEALRTRPENLNEGKLFV